MRINSLHKTALPAQAPDQALQPDAVAPIPVRNVALVIIATGVALFVLQQNDDSAKPPPGVVRVQVEQPSMSATSLLLSSGVSVLMAVNQLVMILFLTYFMLLSDDLFKRKFVELSSTLAEKKLTVEIIND